jgi:hypothetical protein
MTVTPVGGHGYLSGGSANPSHVRNFFTQCESVQLPTDIFSPLWEFEFPRIGNPAQPSGWHTSPRKRKPSFVAGLRQRTSHSPSIKRLSPFLPPIAFVRRHPSEPVPGPVPLAFVPLLWYPWIAFCGSSPAVATFRVSLDDGGLLLHNKR